MGKKPVARSDEHGVLQEEEGDEDGGMGRGYGGDRGGKGKGGFEGSHGTGKGSMGKGGMGKGGMGKGGMGKGGMGKGGTRPSATLFRTAPADPFFEPPPFSPPLPCGFAAPFSDEEGGEEDEDDEEEEEEEGDEDGGMGRGYGGDRGGKGKGGFEGSHGTGKGSMGKGGMGKGGTRPSATLFRTAPADPFFEPPPISSQFSSGFSVPFSDEEGGEEDEDDEEEEEEEGDEDGGMGWGYGGDRGGKGKGGFEGSHGTGKGSMGKGGMGKGGMGKGGMGKGGMGNGFGGGAAAKSGFGFGAVSGATTGFGEGVTPAFGAGATPAFSAAGAAPSFAIGAGAEPAKTVLDEARQAAYVPMDPPTDEEQACLDERLRTPVTIAQVHKFCAAVKESVTSAVFDSFVEVALRLPAAGVPSFAACAHIEAVLSDEGPYEVLQQLGMLYPPYGAKLDASATKQMRGVAEGAASSEALPASEKRISVFGFSGATAKPQNLPTEPDIVVGARVRVQEGVTPSLGWGGVTRDSIGTVVAVRAPAFGPLGPPKEGDTVKVIQATDPDNHPFVGQEGVIVPGGIVPGFPSWSYMVQFEDGNVIGNFDEGDVEVKLDLKVKQTLTRCVFHCPGVGRG